MGIARLKKKTELNYRRGYSWRYCAECNHFVTMEIKGINDEDLGTQPRCRIIGLNAGRMYRIHPASICDSFDGSAKLARVKGEKL